MPSPHADPFGEPKENSIQTLSRDWDCPQQSNHLVKHDAYPTCTTRAKTETPKCSCSDICLRCIVFAQI